MSSGPPPVWRASEGSVMLCMEPASMRYPLGNYNFPFPGHSTQDAKFDS